MCPCLTSYRLDRSLRNFAHTQNTLQERNCLLPVLLPPISFYLSICIQLFSQWEAKEIITTISDTPDLAGFALIAQLTF